MQTFLDGKVTVKQGDLTQETVDAIVNAANSSLMGGGGVDGAIHRSGGAKILEECVSIRNTRYPKGLPTGEAVATTGGNLPARYVIHTVGPIWQGGTYDEERLLANAYRNSLRLAEHMKLNTVAFPSISCGVYGFPKEKAAKIVSQVLQDELSRVQYLTQVILVFFDQRDYELFLREAKF